MAFVDRLQHHVSNVGKAVAIGHTVFQVGKGLYQLGQAAAPFIAGAAALL